MNEETFGQRLRRLRKKAGLNQTQLGKLIGISTVTITRWERNIRQPRMDELKALATALNTSQEELLNGVPAEQQTWVLHVEIGKKVN